MIRTFLTLALALLLCAAASAAITNIPTTLTVNATLGMAADSNFALAGTANFTGVIGNGKIKGTFPYAEIISETGDTWTGAITITLTAGGTLIGTLSLPREVVLGLDTASATVTITDGTGTYSGATGSLTLTGRTSGSILDIITLINLTGAGTIVTGGTPHPTITAVQDAASNTSGIAQGCIFVVKGSNLSASGYTPFAPPRPTVSSGVKVTFTPAAGGTGVDAYLVYLYNQNGTSQLSGILPSTVAPGSYHVTVTNGTVSAPFVAQVVANKVALFTQDSTGGGQASLQNYMGAGVPDLNRLTTSSVSGTPISPAKPG